MSERPDHPAAVPAAGKPFLCPHCRQDSIVRKKTAFDGWKATGEILVCGLCGKQVGTVTANAAPAAAGRGEAEAKLKKAESLLGSRLEPRKTLDREGIERFCKNCVHYLVHPFQSRCLHWNRPVESMSDCAKFELKSIPKAEKPGGFAEKPKAN